MKLQGELLPLVYDELRRLAVQKMAREKPNQTLQATALVHEAWLRLGGEPQAEWRDRAHFFAAAAEAMRWILIDNARRKRAVRHGSGLERVAFESLELASAMPDEQLVAVDEALARLAELHPQKAELVKLRFFVGMTLEEAAKVLGLSGATAKRHWSFARAWLYRELRPAPRKGKIIQPRATPWDKGVNDWSALKGWSRRPLLLYVFPMQAAFELSRPYRALTGLGRFEGIYSQGVALGWIGFALQAPGPPSHSRFAPSPALFNGSCF